MEALLADEIKGMCDIEGRANITGFRRHGIRATVLRKIASGKEEGTILV